jgi:hypothetical protein
MSPAQSDLVTATTDSRTMVGIAKDIYRFQPSVASLRDLEMIHPVDRGCSALRGQPRRWPRNDEARALSHGLR